MRQVDSTTPRLRGFTLPEALAAAMTGAVAAAVAACLLGAGLARDATAEDAARIAQIHRGFLTWSSGRGTTALARPGLISRLAVAGYQLPGVGLENQTKNNTANTYSAMVAQQFLSPRELVSPVETNPVVRVMENYNFASFNPSASTYWDPGFKANIHKLPDGTADGVCHVSYSHLALVGERKREKWRSTAGADVPLFSNRGTYRGATTGLNYALSYSLLFHASPESWEGHVCFGDNHVALESDFQPDGSVYQCGILDLQPDSIFRWEFTATLCDGIRAGDNWLTISIGAPTPTELSYTEAPERRTDGTIPN